MTRHSGFPPSRFSSAPAVVPGSQRAAPLPAPAPAADEPPHDAMHGESSGAPGGHMAGLPQPAAGGRRLPRGHRRRLLRGALRTGGEEARLEPLPVALLPRRAPAAGRGQGAHRHHAAPVQPVEIPLRHRVQHARGRVHRQGDRPPERRVRQGPPRLEHLRGAPRGRRTPSRSSAASTASSSSSTASAGGSSASSGSPRRRSWR